MTFASPAVYKAEGAVVSAGALMDSWITDSLLLWAVSGVVGITGIVVFNRKGHMSPLVFVNVVTAAGLCSLVVAFFRIQTLFAQFGSGIIALDDRDIGDLLVFFLLLGIWGVGAFALILGSRLVGARYASTANVLWAGVQLGMIIVMFNALLAFQAACVSETNGSIGTCGLPIRPGVVVPTSGVDN